MCFVLQSQAEDQLREAEVKLREEPAWHKNDRMQEGDVVSAWGAYAMKEQIYWKWQ